jgi:phage shock protein A
MRDYLSSSDIKRIVNGEKIRIINDLIDEADYYYRETGNEISELMELIKLLKSRMRSLDRYIGKMQNKVNYLSN